jgi:predicted nucleic acid-binding protein
VIVIADTAPLNYLVLVGEVEILPKLFGRVLIPTAVSKGVNAP